MAYVRTKRVPGKDGKVYTYYQLVEGYREGGKVKQKVIAHLGSYPTPEEAASVWEKQAKYRRERAKNLVYAAPLMRAGKVHQLYYGRGKWFLPEHDTPLDGEIPRPGGFAPPGWFYYPGTPDDAEKEAAEEILKADELEEKARLLREAL